MTTKLRKVAPGLYETLDGLWAIERMDGAAESKGYHGKWLLSNALTGQSQECDSFDLAVEWVEELTQRGA